MNENRSLLKICDLGTAIDRSDAATSHNEITPYLVSRFYRAPEIMLGIPYDYAADMWSIGCTLYEMYSGKILFTGDSNNQMLKVMMEIRGKISGKLYRRGDLWRLHFDELGNFISQERDKVLGKVRPVAVPHCPLPAVAPFPCPPFRPPSVPRAPDPTFTPARWPDRSATPLFQYLRSWQVTQSLWAIFTRRCGSRFFFRIRCGWQAPGGAGFESGRLV